MADVDGETDPLWGRLGVEQYLIPKQDCERKTTVTPLREPTAEEIDTILRPYRCEKLWWHADNIYMDRLSPMVLRTHYAKNADEKKRHDKMMEERTNVDLFEEEAWEVEGGDQNILRDNYTEPQDHVEMRAFFKRDIANAKQYDPEAWHNDRESVIESIDTLQQSVAYTFIVIADEKAFESRCLYIIYLDGLRRIIREGRIDPEYDSIGTVAGSWANCYELLGSEFTSLDEKYRINGEIGKELYQLTEEDLADP